MPNDLAAQWADQGSRTESSGEALRKCSADGDVGPEHDSVEKGVALDKKSTDALDWDWDKKEDYTACSMESCNNCGHCSY